jgi:hypothetical protein
VASFGAAIIVARAEAACPDAEILCNFCAATAISGAKRGETVTGLGLWRIAGDADGKRGSPVNPAFTSL